MSSARHIWAAVWRLELLISREHASYSIQSHRRSSSSQHPSTVPERVLKCTILTKLSSATFYDERCCNPVRNEVQEDFKQISQAQSFKVKRKMQVLSPVRGLLSALESSEWKEVEINESVRLVTFNKH